MTNKVGLYLGGAVLAVVLVAGGFWVHGLTPKPAPNPEVGKAFDAAHMTMMQGMENVTYSGDPDDDFAMEMIPHHQGAIDGSEVELKYGTDTGVRIFAARVIAEQQPQIDQMNAWRKAHVKKPVPEAEAIRQAFVEADNKMMMGMMGKDMVHTGIADIDFVRMMIPHHQGAVDMAVVELKYGTDPEMRALAQAIMNSQKAEIKEMEAMKH